MTLQEVRVHVSILIALFNYPYYGLKWLARLVLYFEDCSDLTHRIKITVARRQFFFFFFINSAKCCNGIASICFGSSQIGLQSLLRYIMYLNDVVMSSSVIRRQSCKMLMQSVFYNNQRYKKINREKRL